jgi:ATP-dependent DNA helicase DinG
MTRATELLGPGGPLAATLTAHEFRPGQLEMAEAVQTTLDNEGVLLCEAGTGTGKTLAYLLPALLSGKRVVISTATRALQDQLIEKDVPLAERTLGRPIRATVLKGLSNYLCLRRYREFREGITNGQPALTRHLPILEAWRNSTESGDLAELEGIPEGDPLIDAVRSSADTRIGAQCAFYGECFVTRVKREAESAELVITNHHLFFADLALRGPHPGRVLPDYDAVIFDEAHQLEDVATLFFGVRVSRGRIQTLLRDCSRLLERRATDALADRSIVASAETAEARFTELLTLLGNRDEPRVRLDRESWSGAIHDAYLALDGALDTIETTAELARNDEQAVLESSDAWETVHRRALAVREALAIIVEGAPGRVTWLDKEKTGYALSSSAVDLSSLLRERLFNRIPSVILTSATLTSSPAVLGDVGSTPFAFIRSRLGAFDCEPDVRELVVGSPFDFRANALLYVPKHLPEPSDASFLDSMTSEVESLVQASDGGAFVLTTSLRSMRHLHRSLEHRLRDRPVLMQGRAPKQTLLTAFKESGRAVLVATMSFWEGVDVPGEALRLVVLEKIPFAVPSDPILQARAEALEADGQRPFPALFLPIAQMTLNQGFGRLIRTKADRGVVALLDCRVYRRGYGQRLLSNLPPAKRTVALDEACAFLRAARKL